jgi:hypothetical protein
MAAVTVGGVEKAQAVVVSVEKKARQAVNTERGLMGMVSDADRAGTHGEARGLDARVAQGDSVIG